jgi:hypothetical protein
MRPPPGWALNTVKRYARTATAEQLQRPPHYGRTLVDSYRDHLRRRLAVEPDVTVTRLLAEIRELGCRGSANLLVRYLNQGAPTPYERAGAARPRLDPLLARPQPALQPLRYDATHAPGRRPAHRARLRPTCIFRG